MSWIKDLPIHPETQSVIQRFMHHPVLEEIEAKKKRKRKVHYGFAAALLLLILSVLGAGFFESTGILPSSIDVVRVSSFSAFGIPFVFVAWLILSKILVSNDACDFNTPFKAQLLPEVIRRVDDRLRYSYKEMISKEEFVASGLFRLEPNKYKGGDLFTYDYEGIHVTCSDLYLEKKKKRKNDDTTVFKGQFFVFDLPRSARSPIYVVHNYKGVLGFLNVHFSHLKKMHRVETHNPEFDERFKVFVDSEGASIDFLNPQLQQQLMSLMESWKSMVLFSIVGNKAYLGLYSGRDFFETPIFGQTLAEKRVSNYLNTATQIKEVMLKVGGALK